MTYRRPVGVVLAGGASTRLGEDKALVEFDGWSLAERAARALAPWCERVLIADAGRGVLAGHASIRDGKGCGPAAGILGAAAAAPDRSLLVLACDLPLVPASLLEHLASHAQTADWVVPGRRGRLEPLCALYQARALEALADQVSRKILAPHRLRERDDLEIRYIDETELLTFGDPVEMFANINRPEDLRRVQG